MDKEEIKEFSNMLQFFMDIPQDISDLNSVKEWYSNVSKDILKFNSLSDKFVKILESLEDKEDLEEKEKIKEIKEFLFNFNNKVNPYFLFSEAINFFRKEEYNRAIELWSQISPDYPYISEVYLHLGVTIYLERDDEEEALQWLNKSYQLKQDPVTKKVIDSIQLDLALKKDYAYFRQWQKNTLHHYKELKGLKERANLKLLNIKYPMQYHKLEKAIEMNEQLILIDLTKLEEGLEILNKYKNLDPDDQSLTPHLKDFSDLIKVKIKLGAYRLIPRNINEAVKRMILELSNKFNRLQVNEIAEKCHEPEDVIIIVMKYMLSNKEIDGEYFSSSRSIVFNQRSNKSDHNYPLPKQNIVNEDTEGILKNLKNEIEQLFSTIRLKDVLQMINEIDTLARNQDNKVKIVCRQCNKPAKDKNQTICEFCGANL